MNKIKKILIFTVAVAFSFKGYSQAEISSNMSVGATLLQLMVITATKAEMNFGTIRHTDQGAATVVIGATAASMALSEIRTFSAIGSNDGTANTAGDFSNLNSDEAARAVYQIQGSPTHSYSITLSATTVDLTRELGSGETAGTSTQTMTVNAFKAFVNNNNDDAATGTTIDFSSNAQNIISGGMSKKNESFIGESTLSFGATLNIGAGQRGGKYSVTDGITVSINYE